MTMMIMTMIKPPRWRRSPLSPGRCAGTMEMHARLWLIATTAPPTTASNNYNYNGHRDHDRSIDLAAYLEAS